MPVAETDAVVECSGHFEGDSAGSASPLGRGIRLRLAVPAPARGTGIGSGLRLRLLHRFRIAVPVPVSADPRQIHSREHVEGPQGSREGLKLHRGVARFGGQDDSDGGGIPALGMGMEDLQCRLRLISR